jgi:hypothetical protein
MAHSISAPTFGSGNAFAAGIATPPTFSFGGAAAGQSGIIPQHTPQEQPQQGGMFGQQPAAQVGYATFAEDACKAEMPGTADCLLVNVSHLTSVKVRCALAGGGLHSRGWAAGATAAPSTQNEACHTPMMLAAVRTVVALPLKVVVMVVA